MSYFDDRIAVISLSSIRNTVIGFCVSAGLKVTNWRVQGVSNQIKEAIVGAIHTFSSVIPAMVRGFASLDTSVDPGDDDPFDTTNKTLPPDYGFLSQFGKGTFNTTRQDATFATGNVSFTNAGPGSRDISPRGLIFTWTLNSPPSPPPTYVNVEDAAIYGTSNVVTVPAGSSITIPVQCQVKGAVGSAPSNSLSLTTTLVGCTATNANQIAGNDREVAVTFRDRCRQAAARLSFAGPADAYAYLAAKKLDGTVLMNGGTPSAPSGITRVQVTQASSTGIVNAYFASASGAAIPDDVTAANNNIRINAFAVPDAITYTGVAATVLSISVSGTARIKNRVGLVAADVSAKLAAGAVAYGPTIPVGGFDQVAGAGVVYSRDIEDAAGKAARDAGFEVYAVTVTIPAGATTAVAVGQAPIVSSAAINWTVTVV